MAISLGIYPIFRHTHVPKKSSLPQTPQVRSVHHRSPEQRISFLSGEQTSYSQAWHSNHCQCFLELKAGSTTMTILVESTLFVGPPLIDSLQNVSMWATAWKLQSSYTLSHNIPQQRQNRPALLIGFPCQSCRVHNSTMLLTGRDEPPTC